MINSFLRRYVYINRYSNTNITSTTHHALATKPQRRPDSYLKMALHNSFTYLLTYLLTYITRKQAR